MSTSLTDRDLLRMYLGERIPDGGDDVDTFFTNEELDMLIEASPYGINGAAVLGWAAKAGEYARLIDLNESGAERKFSQKFRQASTQLQYFQAAVQTQLATETTSGRTVGRSIDWAAVGNGPTLVLWRNRHARMPYFPSLYS